MCVRGRCLSCVSALLLKSWVWLCAIDWGSDLRRTWRSARQSKVYSHDLFLGFSGWADEAGIILAALIPFLRDVFFTSRAAFGCIEVGYRRDDCHVTRSGDGWNTAIQLVSSIVYADFLCSLDFDITTGWIAIKAAGLRSPERWRVHLEA